MIKKCLFPAAGYGTRFFPVTKAVPKEMLPILTKPLLQYGVEEALSAGITNMAIVSGKGKRAIEDHFDNSFELEAQLGQSLNKPNLKEINDIISKSTFTYVRQKKMRGLGHAVLTAEPLIGKQPFAVILADDFCYCNKDAVIKQLIKIYNKFKCSIIAIEEVPISQTEKYGVIAGNLIDNSIDTYLVTEMVEKPEAKNAPSNMAIIGRYILSPEIFNILRNMKSNDKQEMQLTDALNIQARQGKVIAYKFKGKRFDCGNIEGYIQANNFLAVKKGII